MTAARSVAQARTFTGRPTEAHVKVGSQTRPVSWNSAESDRGSRGDEPEPCSPETDSREMRALMKVLAGMRGETGARNWIGDLDSLRHEGTPEREEPPEAVSGLHGSVEFLSDEDPIRPYAAKATSALPAGRPTRRIAALAALAIPLLAAAGLAGIYLRSNGGPPDPSPAEVQAAPKLSTAVQAGGAGPGDAVGIPLLQTRVDYLQTFSRLFAEPEAVCQALDLAGLRATAWQRSQWDAATWECSTRLGLQSADQTEQGSQDRFFFIIRGVGADRVTSLRVKVSLVQGDMAAVGKIRQFLGVLADFKDLAIPALVTDAVIEGRPAMLTTVSGAFRFESERGDPRNFNLIVSYVPSTVGVLRTAPEALSREGIDDAG